jgi:hypothetical protein
MSFFKLLLSRLCIPLFKPTIIIGKFRVKNSSEMNFEKDENYCFFNTTP